MDQLIAWFRSHNGTIDTTAMKIQDISGCGRGAVALRDLPVSNLSIAYTSEEILTIAIAGGALVILYTAGAHIIDAYV